MNMTPAKRRPPAALSPWRPGSASRSAAPMRTPAPGAHRALAPRDPDTHSRSSADFRPKGPAGVPTRPQPRRPCVSVLVCCRPKIGTLMPFATHTPTPARPPQQDSKSGLPLALPASPLWRMPRGQHCIKSLGSPPAPSTASGRGAAWTNEADCRLPAVGPVTS